MEIKTMAKKDYSSWTKEELIRELEKFKKQKKYGIVWEDKPEQVALMCKEKLPVLTEIKNKEIKIDETKPINILIEGDNYHALSVLNYTHKGKIDVIYIDPPYNTRARDWKYNNDYVDINDQWRHSKWLSMMEKRLKLSKNLLKHDGVLICTIDDNEFHHLGCLLEEIFNGWEMHCITIIHNPRGIQGNNFSYCHEYAYFVFRKGLSIIGDKTRDEILEEEFKDHGSESLRTDARNCFYPILVKDEKIIGFGEVPDNDYHPKFKNILRKDGTIEVWPIDIKKIERKWVFARQTVEKIKEKLYIVKKKNGEIDIWRKKDTQKPRTVWVGKQYDASTYGSKIVNKLTGTNFPFPKSIFNTRDCLECVIKQRKNAIVLDFFAGSGTTGHAVILLNNEDNGKRKFILCTNNEVGEKSEKEFKKKYKIDDTTLKEWKETNKKEWVEWQEKYGICSAVCYPRIKAVMKKHEDYPEITGIKTNLKYFKTDFVDAKPIDKNKKKLVDESTEMLCLKEDCFNFILKGKSFKIFKNNEDKYLGIIYDDEGIEPFKNEAIKINKKFVVYVFSLDDSAREEEFEDLENIELKPIPAVILNVYKRIFRGI